MDKAFKLVVYLNRRYVCKIKTKDGIEVFFKELNMFEWNEISEERNTNKWFYISKRNDL